jgi:hypothetical protein
MDAEFHSLSRLTRGEDSGYTQEDFSVTGSLCRYLAISPVQGLRLTVASRVGEPA